MPVAPTPHPPPGGVALPVSLCSFPVSRFALSPCPSATPARSATQHPPLAVPSPRLAGTPLATDVTRFVIPRHAVSLTDAPCRPLRSRASPHPRFVGVRSRPRRPPWGFARSRALFSRNAAPAPCRLRAPRPPCFGGFGPLRASPGPVWHGTCEEKGEGDARRGAPRNPKPDRSPPCPSRRPTRTPPSLAT